MSDPIVKNIYKFRAMSVESLSALASSKIWFSSQDNLNDPFEGVVNMIEPSTEGEKIKKALEFSARATQKQANVSESEATKIVMSRYLNDPADVMAFVDEGIKQFKNDLSEYRSKMGIFSTASDIPNDKRTQVSNMLLWSHYADEFRGFCVKYDGELLLDSLEKSDPETTFAWTTVDYVNSPHTIDMLGDPELSADKFLSSIRRKHDQWQYECEVRLISTTTGLKTFSPEAIRGIYIGERMPEEQEYLLRGLVSHHFPEAEVFKVSTDKNSYGIAVEKM